MECDRREFLKTTAALATGLGAISTEAAPKTAGLPEPTAAKLPRWKGFNLLEKFNAANDRPFLESDFALMAEWGFNFARLPLSYLCWSSPDHWLEMNQAALKEIDQAVEYGRQYGIHVNINLHRAPGYCVNPPAEPRSIWKDADALDACCTHWAMFAQRYKGISNRQVSFDLLNEPPVIEDALYLPVLKALTGAIRQVDPTRLIIADGSEYGRKPLNGFADLRVGGSTRGYDPFQLTHWKAEWAENSDTWPVPTWPYRDSTGRWDKERLQAERIAPWKTLETWGVGVHVGEWGVYNRTPHDIALRWMHDVLAAWQEAGWGWALWNLRGDFGPLDSKRVDVKYENFRGHKLDRAMLDMLRADLPA